MLSIVVTRRTFLQSAGLALASGFTKVAASFFDWLTRMFTTYGEALLPAPCSWAADADPLGNLEHRQALGRQNTTRARSTCFNGRDRSPTISARRTR